MQQNLGSLTGLWQHTYCFSQLEVCIEEGLDGTNVFPVVVEQVGNSLQAILGGHGDDFPTKIIGAWVPVLQQLHQDILLEDVDTHGGNVWLGFRLLWVKTCIDKFECQLHVLVRRISKTVHNDDADECEESAWLLCSLF